MPRDHALVGGGLLGLRPRGFYAASTDMVAVNQDMPALVERYASLRIPAGILYGTGDRILAPRVHGGGMRSRVTGLRLEMIACGHMIPLTAPNRVAAFRRAGRGQPGPGELRVAGRPFRWMGAIQSSGLHNTDGPPRVFPQVPGTGHTRTQSVIALLNGVPVVMPDHP